MDNIQSIIKNMKVVEDDEQTEKELLRDQKKEEYAEYFKNSNIPKKYRTAYEKDIEPKIFEELKQKRFSIVKGNLGTGKTYLASAFLNTAFIKQSVNGFFVRCHILETFDLNELKEFLNNCKNKKILVIDDIGMIKANDFVKRQVASMILYRAEEDKRTIITTNESLKNIFDDRIFDKIAEDFELIELIGENRRKKK